VSLVERLGGRVVLDPAVAQLYRRVMADELLAPIFAGIDVATLIHMQQEFLAVALDAEPDHSADAIRRIHAGRGITHQHFSRFVEHFLLALEDLGVPSDLAALVGQRLALYADDVVGDVAEAG
jgi:hemoglobin